MDYRYLPGPDLPPILISKKLVSRVRESLPDKQLEYLTQSPDHCLNFKEAEALVALDDSKRLDYYEAVRRMVQKNIKEL